MKILILGSGFIGKSLNNYFSNKEAMTSVASRSTRVGDKYFDLFDESTIRSLIDSVNPDVVVNTVWNTELSTYVMSPLNSEYAAANIKLGEICIEKGVRHLISFGTSAEYGENPGACDSDLTPCQPESIYAKSKFSAYQTLAKMYRHSILRFTWVRLFQPYGKYQDASRFIPNLIQTLRNGQEVELDNPNTQLDWISSLDVARAVDFVIKNETPVAIDLGSSRPVYNFEVLNMVKESLGLPLRTIESSVSSLNGTSRFVSSQSFLLQSWSPELSLPNGLQRLVCELEKN